jgi:putative FmdB family regulatory protein
VPIYEFSCSACGTRFERLVDLGTAAAECPECDARARRVLSAQAAPMRLVKPAGERRKQERRNAALRESTKSTFKQARERTRAERSRAKGGE